MCQQVILESRAVNYFTITTMLVIKLSTLFYYFLNVF